MSAEQDLPIRVYRLDVERAGSIPLEHVLVAATDPARAADLALQRARRRWQTQSLRVLGCWAFPDGEFAAMGAGQLELLAGDAGGGPVDVIDTGWLEPPAPECPGCHPSGGERYRRGEDIRQKEDGSLICLACGRVVSSPENDDVP